MPRQFNPNPKHPAVAYLVRLHADLGFQVDASQQAAKRIAEQMKHVEAVIRLFDPNYDVRAIAVKRRQQVNKWFKRGHMFRAAVDILKTAPLPMTAMELTWRVLATQGVTDIDPKTLRNMECGMRSCLRLNEGKTVENVAEGMPAKWRLISR